MTSLAAYLRCSTAEQTVEPQRVELRRWLAYAHPDLDYDADVREYVDEGVSGADWKRGKRVARPAYDELVLDLASASAMPPGTAREPTIARRLPSGRISACARTTLPERGRLAGMCRS